jgi:hypothetical protein
MSTYLRAQRTITTRDAKGRPFRIGIRALYTGGAYVELWFGASNDPSEVINVWNYAKGRSELGSNPTQAQLAAVLREWIDSNEEDERSYRDTDSLERYGWLRTYFDNSDAGVGIRRVFDRWDGR